MSPLCTTIAARNYSLLNQTERFLKLGRRRKAVLLLGMSTKAASCIACGDTSESLKLEYDGRKERHAECAVTTFVLRAACVFEVPHLCFDAF